MKYKDFDKVKELMEVIKNLSKASKTLKNGEVEFKKLNSNGIADCTDIGHSCFISKYSDGSGKLVDLAGCYVGNEIFDAVESILEKKFEVCKTALEKLGVDVSDLILEK